MPDRRKWRRACDRVWTAGAGPPVAQTPRSQRGYDAGGSVAEGMYVQLRSDAFHDRLRQHDQFQLTNDLLSNCEATARYVALSSRTRHVFVARCDRCNDLIPEGWRSGGKKKRSQLRPLRLTLGLFYWLVLRRIGGWADRQDKPGLIKRVAYHTIFKGSRSTSTTRRE